MTDRPRFRHKGPRTFLVVVKRDRPFLKDYRVGSYRSMEAAEQALADFRRSEYWQGQNLQVTDND